MNNTTPAKLPLLDRRFGAARLRAQKAGIAARATQTFLSRHPEWLERFGAAATRRGEEDAAHHVAFLAAALETGEQAAFTDYVAWLVDVLSSRGISREAVAENLELAGNEALLAVDEASRETLERMIRAGVARAEGPLEAPPVTEDILNASPLANASRLFLHALLQGERSAALGVAREALRVAAHPMDVYVDVIQHSLEEIGRQWQLNRITVAQEHMATALVQFVLAQLYTSLDRSAPVRGSALITGVEGELHQVGGNLIADALELDGWRVRFLGANVPHDGAVAAAEEIGAEMIGISATMLFNLEAVARLIDNVRSVGGAHRILVGGRAFRSAPLLWQEVGADGFAMDVRGACVLAR